MPRRARAASSGRCTACPIGVKDLFQVAGTHTRRGSRLYENDLASETAPAVERLLAAGAIMVGKNTTPEVGWKASSNSPLYGVTRNPWDTVAHHGRLELGLGGGGGGGNGADLARHRWRRVGAHSRGASAASSR